MQTYFPVFDHMFVDTVGAYNMNCVSGFVRLYAAVYKARARY